MTKNSFGVISKVPIYRLSIQSHTDPKLSYGWIILPVPVTGSTCNNVDRRCAEQSRSLVVIKAIFRQKLYLDEIPVPI